MNMEHTCADRFDPDEINRRLLSFLDRSPVSFYAVRNMAEELENAGAVRLFEGERWKLLPAGPLDYYGHERLSPGHMRWHSPV